MVPFEVDDASDKPRIELDLGLGVLEERDPNADSSSEDEGEEQSVLGKLMGKETSTTRPGIQDMTTDTNNDKHED